MSLEHLVYGIYDESLHPNTNRPTIKIGFTDNIEERIRKLQTGNSCSLRYINRIFVPEHLMQHEETLGHNYFEDYRLGGEHFDISPEQLNTYFKTRQEEYGQTEGLDGEIIINKKYRDVKRKAPPCFFYPEQQAQDKYGPKSKAVLSAKIKKTTRYRSMTWLDIDKSNKSFAGKNKKGESQVYISCKKHLENLKELEEEKKRIKLDSKKVTF